MVEAGVTAELLADITEPYANSMVVRSQPATSAINILELRSMLHDDCCCFQSLLLRGICFTRIAVCIYESLAALTLYCM